METENTIRYCNAARNYSKRARVLISHTPAVSRDETALPTPSVGTTVTDSHKEPFTVHDDGSLRRIVPKLPSRRDRIRAFGRYMGRS